MSRVGEWADRARRAGNDAVARLAAARPRSRAVDAAWELWDLDRAKAATLLSGALVYRMFVWLLPVTLLAASLLGFLAAANPADPADLAREAGVGSYMVSVVADAAATSETSRWITLVLALFGIAWAGSSAVRAFRLTHALVWDVELTRLVHPWLGTVILLGLTLGAGVLASLSWKARDASPGLGLPSILLSTLAFGSLWALASWLLPHGDAPWWALVPGAVVGAVGVVAMHLFTVYYLAGKIEHASKMYGSLGAAAAVLLWLSLFARLTIVGAGLNATLWHRRERLGAPRPSPAEGDGLPRPPAELWDSP